MTISFDPSLVDDPYPVYARLRAEAPAYHGDSHDFWALSRFDDVKAALSDHETFCSSQGLIVLQATGEYEAPEFPPGNLLLMDPPEHTAYRHLVNRRFLQRAVAEIEPRTSATAHGLIDRFCERGTADLVAEFTVALPAIVFGGILGIPDGDIDQFQQWSARLVSPAPTPEAMAAHSDAAAAVSAYFADLLAARRRHPADDLLTEIANGDLDGEPIGDAEAVGFAIAMLIAGNDTTSNLLANASWLLAKYPDQRALLAEDPDRIPGAVEEILRFEPPVHGLARTLTRDVELHGQTLPAGKKVLLLFAAANRDEREFEDPERFDVTRTVDGHLSFGFGIHYCVGIHLGRLEGRIGLATLLARLPDYAVDVDDVHWRQLVPTRPMDTLPATFTPGRPTG